MRIFEQAVPQNANFDFFETMLTTTPRFIMADASWRRTIYTSSPTAQTAASMEVVSDGFYKYDRLNHVLRTPDGLVCSYDATTGRLLEFHDQFNNSVELQWSATAVLVKQHVGVQTREITLSLDDHGRVTGMSYADRQWTYTYDYVFEDTKDITHVVMP